MGEIKPTPEICTACLAPTFSFASNNELCDACPANAKCTGGAVVVPNLQYWHSAPNSDFMVQCPNRKACEGNREELHSCKQQALLAELDPTLVHNLVQLTRFYARGTNCWTAHVLIRTYKCCCTDVDLMKCMSTHAPPCLQGCRRRLGLCCKQLHLTL